MTYRTNEKPSIKEEVAKLRCEFIVNKQKRIDKVIDDVEETIKECASKGITNIGFLIPYKSVRHTGSLWWRKSFVIGDAKRLFDKLIDIDLEPWLTLSPYYETTWIKIDGMEYDSVWNYGITFDL